MKQKTSVSTYIVVRQKTRLSRAIVLNVSKEFLNERWFGEECKARQLCEYFRSQCPTEVRM